MLGTKEFSLKSGNIFVNTLLLSIDTFSGDISVLTNLSTLNLYKQLVTWYSLNMGKNFHLGHASQSTIVGF